MGTYGVTHVKKDNKIIPFSDSYDGYLSGMGLAGLFSIKYISDQKLGELFDQYTARKPHVFGDNTQNHYEQEEIELTQRAIDEVIYQVKEDTKDNSDAINWINNALSDDVRASMSGFGPLLYLNVHPHYGEDYDYCNYLIDLDNKTFSSGNDSIYTIPFDLIRSAKDSVLRYFADQKKDLLTEEQKLLSQEDLLTTFPDKILMEKVEITEEEKNKFKKDANTIISAYFALDPLMIDIEYKKEEEQREIHRQKCLDAYNESLSNKQQNTLKEEDNYGAFSIRNARDIAPIQLRTVQAFLNRLEKVLPQTAYLSANADWGMNEDYTAGGIRFFSPMENNNSMHECFDTVMNVIEYQFKIGLSIFSSTGSWSHDIKETESTGFFGNAMGITAGPDQSYFLLEEVKQFEQGSLIIDTVNPYLGYHVKYENMRSLLLGGKNQEQVGLAAVFWTYLAILNQDIEVFDKVYPLANTQLANMNDIDSETAKKRLLTTLADSKLIVSSILSLKESTDLKKEQLEKVNTTDQFVNHLKTTSFFNDLLPVMNNSEKSQYGFGVKNKMK